MHIHFQLVQQCDYIYQNKFFKCTYVHLCLFHSKPVQHVQDLLILSNIQHYVPAVTKENSIHFAGILKSLPFTTLGWFPTNPVDMPWYLFPSVQDFIHNFEMHYFYEESLSSSCSYSVTKFNADGSTELYTKACFRGSRQFESKEWGKLQCCPLVRIVPRSSIVSQLDIFKKNTRVFLKWIYPRLIGFYSVGIPIVRVHRRL